MIQSIASAATQMQQEMVQAEVGAGVSKMALNSAEMQGQALVDMIEMQREIQSHLGGNMNTFV